MSENLGRFVWDELLVPDVDKGVDFCTTVLGFTATSMDMGAFTYHMVGKDKPAIGVLSPQNDFLDKTWAGYIMVDDVDAKAEAVTAAGGKVLIPPYDLPTVGRACLFEDPGGARAYLFRSESGESELFPDIQWHELIADDVATVAAFYAAVFGYDIAEEDMGNGGTYTMLMADGRPAAGIAPAGDGALPVGWISYLWADDVDAAFEQTVGRGGEVLMPPVDMPGMGRFGVARDEQGVVVGMITPAA